MVGTGSRKRQFFVLFMFLRQISVFHCEIATADMAEFNIFLCTAEHPIPNSNPHENCCSGFHSPHGLEIGLNSQIF